MENLVKDFEMNSALEKVLSFCVFMSLFFLAVGALTSISILSLSHVFIILPALYFIPKANYKNYPKSAWALLAFAIVLVLSVVVNQDIISNGYKNISKTKYFFIGFLSIAPLSWYIKKHLTRKKLSLLLHVFMIAAVFSTVSGLIGKFTGINPITGKAPLILDRNSGMMGMVMNYAHNLSLLLIINLGLIFYQRKLKKVIDIKVLLICLFINLVGFYFSYTRGAWIGFLGALPFLFLNKGWRSYITITALVLLIGSGMYYVANSQVQRSASNNERVDLWKAALFAAKERPVMGYGYLNFEPHSVEIKEKLNLPTAADIKSHAHNNILEIAATSGLVGLILYIMWNLFWILELFKSRKNILSTFAIALLIGMSLGGLTQATISLGINLFLILGIYSISQIDIDIKESI